MPADLRFPKAHALSSTDLTLLKAIRYEDAHDGVPPIAVTSINPPRSPNSRSFTAHASRPRTSPSTPTTVASEKAKRDSGIAPSFSTIGRASYAEDTNLSPTVAGAAKEPRLPTILVQDDESPPAIEKRTSPFAKRKPKEKLLRGRASTPALGGIKRVDTFQGIQSEIPSGSLDDINLEDLATDFVNFSKRGSLLLGGKTINQMAAAPVVQRTPSDRSTSPAPIPEEAVGNGAPEEELTGPGLRSGRRKPSVQMLQAAINGGRVLSAEEISFSMRVRSMYAAGDEKAAEWAISQRNGARAEQASNGGASGSKTPIDNSIDGVLVGKQRPRQQDVHPALRSPTPEVVSVPEINVSYCKEPTELAGGVEDWNDVQGEDVDRYGFISPPRLGSSGGPEQGIQRVATSLRLEADQPRRSRVLRRGTSIATRGSKSVPPKSREGTIRNGSMHSIQSTRSTGTNPFRSRARKTLDGAGDMLRLPPGLADIAEQEDSGRTASMMKKREWSREAKWQDMARPINRPRSGSKGGGMRFDFDTTDQKLVSRTWKGIPDRWRASAWYSFLDASAKKRNLHATEDSLIQAFHAHQAESSADDVQIDVDVPRTINMHIMFRRRYRGGQRLLFRVLHAISLHFPDTGYVQGMASLAATLLCYFDEEHAFIMLVRLWQLRGLEQLFQTGFEGLMAALREFETDWLQGGEVAKKLDDLGISSTAYGTRWYLTLFNMSIPFPAQLRVWDAFMLLGDAPTQKQGLGKFGGADLDVLHATSAALIDATREILLDSEFENAMKVLTSFVPVKDEDLLMRVARTEWKLRKKRGVGKQ